MISRDGNIYEWQKEFGCCCSIGVAFGGFDGAGGAGACKKHGQTAHSEADGNSACIGRRGGTDDSAPL